MPHLTAIVYINVPPNSIKSKIESSRLLIMFYILCIFLCCYCSLCPFMHIPLNLIVSMPSPYAG